VARQGGVDTASALDEPGEAVVAGCKPDAGAHGGDVIEMAPGPLQLEQDRPHPSELRRRLKTEALLACVCVREPVRHGARAAGAPDPRDPLVQRVALRSRFETAVLVEQPGIDVEDAVADDVKAKMPRLDHARMNRADRYLVRVVAVDRHRPVPEVEVVVDERPQWLVPGERDSVQVVCLPLVPVRGGSEVDDRRNTLLRAGPDGLETHAAAVVDEHGLARAFHRRGVEPAYRQPPSSACPTVSR
jgi:hypothetical protein